jgi:N-acetyl-anhydromuramyl-L-alanine amidase AmpD
MFPHARLLTAFSALMLAGCAHPRFGRPGVELHRSGDEIVVCGRLFHCGAPVVLWTDPGGYDAYRVECRFNPEQTRPSDPVSDGPARYGSLRRHLPADVAERVRDTGWPLDLLREHVDLFVMHYDVCGASRRCFRVLHDVRGLSVHFLLDVDGTIYQTLDLKERAWHAGSANDRSIGVEIANIGAYEDMRVLDEWYHRRSDGRTVVQFPASIGEPGIRTPHFVAQPARNEPIVGYIHGRWLMQYDLTPQQYRSLARLCAAVSRVLPRIRLDVPRDAHGAPRMDVLSAGELQDYHGLIGHYHLTREKVDPGPAFDWQRLVRESRRLAR